MSTQDKMTIDERRKYLRRMNTRYLKANRKEKGRLLDEMEAGAGKTLPLPFPRRFHPLADAARRLSQPLIGQLVVVHPGDFYVNVKAVEQGAGDAFLVAADHGEGAGAFPHWIAVVPTGASLRCLFAISP